MKVKTFVSIPSPSPLPQCFDKLTTRGRGNFSSSDRELSQ